jgi:hypothetical protein
MNPENFKIINVTRDLVSIEVLDPSEFNHEFNIGSYIKIPHTSAYDYIIGIIKNYRIKNLDISAPDSDVQGNHFIIDVQLIGSYSKVEGDYKFERGAQGIPLPPNNGIDLVDNNDFKNIYSCKLSDSEEFSFSSLVQVPAVNVPINGNKFFNKHFAIVGSTGCGKSHTVASIIQSAVKEKDSGYDGLNNSHVVLFDIHGEYHEAFPDSNIITSKNIKLPYWLLDSEELGDLFIESTESNSHNQISQFRYAVTENKKKENPDLAQDKIYYDSPLKFNIDEVIQYIINLNNEMIGRRPGEGFPKDIDGNLIANRLDKYFTENISFAEQSSAAATKTGSGPFKGDFERFILRLETIRNNPRLKFLFDDTYNFDLEDVLKEFLGYGDKPSNITVIDLTGIPFEVLSVTVSVISRVLFEYGYYYTKTLKKGEENNTPLLLVYEEAHKYVPKSDLVRYRASKTAIERIAKEGRKYGVTMGIVSQRPSEVSETIFSQCNNFIAMRLTNPDDQNYVKRLLPDSMLELTNYLPSLQSGQAIIIGESIIIPSLVTIHMPDNEPKSGDINYFDIWKKPWIQSVKFGAITNEWKK